MGFESGPVDRSFYFARDVWYHGYVKTFDQQMYLWVREDTGADWTAYEHQTTAPLITNGDMPLYPQGDRVRVNLNPMGYYNAQDQLRLRDITIKTWHCAAEIPDLPPVMGTVEIWPNMIDFGYVASGQTSDRTFTLFNPGTAIAGGWVTAPLPFTVVGGSATEAAYWISYYLSPVNPREFTLDPEPLTRVHGRIGWNLEDWWIYGD